MNQIKTFGVPNRTCVRRRKPATSTKRTVLGIKKEGPYGLLFVVPGTGTL